LGGFTIRPTWGTGQRREIRGKGGVEERGWTNGDLACDVGTEGDGGELVDLVLDGALDAVEFVVAAALSALAREAL